MMPPGKTRVVLDPVGRDDLPAGDAALEDDGVGAAARRVQRRGQAARPGADDRDADVLSGHWVVTPAVGVVE